MHLGILDENDGKCQFGLVLHFPNIMQNLEIVIATYICMGIHHSNPSNFSSLLVQLNIMLPNLQ